MEVCPAFIDETGVLTGSPQQQPVYGIGLLLIPDPRQITESLYRVHFNFVQDRRVARSKLRKEIESRAVSPTLAEVDRLMWSSRHHEYKYSDITRFNLQHYVDLLNIYFSYPDTEFHSLSSVETIRMPI